MSKFSYEFYKMIVDSKGIIEHKGEVVADVYCGKDYSIINIFDLKALYEMTNNIGSKKIASYSDNPRTIWNTITKRLRRIGGFCIRDINIGDQNIVSYYIPFFTPLREWKTLSELTESKYGLIGLTQKQ